MIYRLGYEAPKKHPVRVGPDPDGQGRSLGVGMGFRRILRLLSSGFWASGFAEELDRALAARRARPFADPSRHALATKLDTAVIADEMGKV